MPRYNVLCRVDAYVDYVAEIEAENAHEAARTAADDITSRYKWEERGTQEFDARLYVTVDNDGIEIDGTQAGDC